MKKFLFILLTFFLFPVISYGQCRTIDQTLMYVDADRFIFVEMIGSRFHEQGLNLIFNDLKSGKAVLIPSGVEISGISPINEFICVAVINNRPLIALRKHITREKNGR